MKEYAVIYEQGKTNWGALEPDLPGCVSIGDSLIPDPLYLGY